MRLDMREIKFRVYDHDKKQMLLPGKDIIILSNNGVTADTETWSIMQFTGLKDKNGKEVFEGDILSDEDEFVPELDIVEWNTKTARWVFPEAIGGYYPLNESRAVIGNVYENPDLLKEKTNA
jgi:hypothetical protein